MKLVVSPTSPYSRKVRVLIIEKGLQDTVEIVMASPLADGTQDIIRNPLGKVPSLILPDGKVVFDSPVICAFIDAKFSGPRLVPVDGNRKWNSDCAQALGDGILDAAFNIVMERQRPSVEQSAFWKERWATAIMNGVKAIDEARTELSSDLNIGAITCAVALGYLEFRLPEIEWRSDFPELKSFFGDFSQRPSFFQTAPSQT